MNSNDEFRALAHSYEQSGGDLVLLQDPQVARLVVSGNRVLNQNGIPGVHMRVEEMEHGVEVWLNVDAGTVLEQPVHLCFGVIPTHGRQEIVSHLDIGDHARVEFLSHCSFPNAVEVVHLMDAEAKVGIGASMSYQEVHYHGPHGGVVVRPISRATVGPGGKYFVNFKVIEGRIGELDIDMTADLEAGAVAELTTKAYGKADDKIRVRETIFLKGAEARGLTKTNVVVVDQAHSDVYTEMHGLAPRTRGHMECTEVVGGRGSARNVPVVLVTEETAKVTHEAAIGSVDRKQVETLMARGLTEDEAVDVVVGGLLR